MGVEEIVTINISLSAVNPSRQSFGVGLLAAYHTSYADRVRTYSNLPAVAVDFPASSTAVGAKHIYKAASVYFAADPAPASLKIGRRTRSFTSTLQVTVLDATAGDTIAFESEGSSTAYVIAASATNTSLVATALLPYIAHAASCTATASTNVITITSLVPGHVLDFGGWSRTQLQVKNTTVDPGIASDLDEIKAADSAGSAGGFYGLCIDNQGSAETTATAAWAEAQAYKEFFVDTVDWDVVSSTTTDICTTLKTAAYKRTVPLFNGQGTRAYSSMGLMAASLSNDPGSYTLDLMTLPSVSTDALTDTEASNAQGKNCNVYRSIESLNVINKGTNASGLFEDTIRFRDFLKSDMQTRVLIVLKGSKKIPYTRKGIRAVGTAIDGALQDGIRVGGLSDDPDAVNIAVLPDIKTISPADRTARNLPSVSFQATEAGAIQSVTINGVITA